MVGRVKTGGGGLEGRGDTWSLRPRRPASCRTSSTRPSRRPKYAALPNACTQSERAHSMHVLIRRAGGVCSDMLLHIARIHRTDRQRRAVYVLMQISLSTWDLNNQSMNRVKRLVGTL